MKLNLKQRTNKKLEAFAEHFRLLGLRIGECRTNIIRSAAQATSVAHSYSNNPAVLDHLQPHRDDLRRARIAIAAYRLLDPRERSDIYERVQLCYPIDRDEMVEPSNSAAKLIDQMPIVIAITPRPTSFGVKLMRQPLIDQAIEGKTPSDEKPGADDSLKSTGPFSSELSLEERRSLVRLLRNSEESSLRNLSPLGWLRSRLGM